MITWQSLQYALRSAGAITVVFAHTNTLAIVQGSAFPGPSKASQYCPNDAQWREFYDAYRKLSPSDQSALTSPSGLLVPADPSEVSENVRRLSPSLFNPSFSSPARIRLRLATSLESSFPDAPKGLISGYWHWSDARTGSPIKFPLEVNLSSQMLNLKSAKPLQLGNQPSLSQVILKLSKASGFEVRVNEKVHWPVISTNGPVALGDFLTCLKIATVANPRYLQNERLLYIAPASDVGKFLPDAAIPNDEVSAYTTLVSAAGQADGTDLGPLLYGVLQLPTSALDADWVKSIMSDIPPESAVEQAQASSLKPDLQRDALVDVWTKTYAPYTIFSYPGLVFIGLRERPAPDHPGEWDVTSRNNINIPRVCY